MKDVHFNDFRETHELWEAQPPVSHAPGLSPLSRDILGAICHLTVGGGKAGCACCPPELRLSCPHEPSPGFEPRFVPERELAGSFTAPGVREVILATTECRRNLGSYGAMVLARETPDGWKLIDMDVGMAITEAIPWHLDNGLDVLVALRKVGKTVVHRLDVLRFDQPDLDRTLVAWSNQADNCYRMGVGIHTGRAELVGSRKADADGDGKTDLVVRIEAQAGKATRAMVSTCDAHFDGKAPSPALRLPRRTFELVFRFDGMRFHADEKKLQAFATFVAGPQPQR
jgi:hypothetical protein